MSSEDDLCLHCEVGHLVVDFMEKHPDYSKAEAAQDLMKIASQFLKMCLESGVELGEGFEVIHVPSEDSTVKH
jgi:hypothetical protein